MGRMVFKITIMQNNIDSEKAVGGGVSLGKLYTILAGTVILGFKVMSCVYSI